MSKNVRILRCIALSRLDLVQTCACSTLLPRLAQEVEVVRLDEGQYADYTGA